MEIGHNPNPRPKGLASTESEQGPSASNDGLDSNGNAVNSDSLDKNKKVKISPANQGTADKGTAEKGGTDGRLIQEE